MKVLVCFTDKTKTPIEDVIDTGRHAGDLYVDTELARYIFNRRHWVTYIEVADSADTASVQPGREETK